MKKFIFYFFIWVFSFISIWFVASKDVEWKDNPIDLIDNLKDNNIQSGAIGKSSEYSQWNGIKWTLDILSKELTPYLKWIIFVSLVIGTILIMINGIELMKNASTGKEWEIWKIKTRMINIVIWVSIVVGFTIIVKIFVSVINSIFK